jgi:hypothetical protein
MAVVDDWHRLRLLWQMLQLADFFPSFLLSGVKCRHISELGGGILVDDVPVVVVVEDPVLVDEVLFVFVQVFQKNLGA